MLDMFIWICSSTVMFVIVPTIYRFIYNKREQKNKNNMF